MLDLQVRYVREFADLGLPNREEHFTYGHAQWQIPVQESALVLVDCWAKHPVDSVTEATERVARELILPVVQACRRAGVIVIHAPSLELATNYKEYNPYTSDVNDNDATKQMSESDWPPRSFCCREGFYDVFNLPSVIREQAFQRWCQVNPPESLRIFEFLGPQEGDKVIATGRDLHKLSREHRLLHFFYAGFATNICLQHRDYGMRAMRGRGYNVLLLRDCTCGIEFDDSISEQWLTRSAVTNIEMKVGPSLTGDQLRSACLAST